MKIAYLDRDGVINKKAEEHNYITKWKDFKFLDNGLYLLENLIKLNYNIIIVTNQQGIGKKIFTTANLEDIHNKMIESLKKRGIKIKKIYHCPHLIKDNCNCRKPEIGMLKKSLVDFPQINKEKSILIGDSQTDLEAGLNFGINSFFFSDDITMINQILSKLKN